MQVLAFEKLFSGPYATARGGLARASYDVFPDGSFLILKPAAQHEPLTQINIVLGCSQAKRRATCKLDEATTLPMPPDQDEVNRWSGSAPYWEKHREVIRQMFAPVTQALAEDAQISARQTVLDIATGPGEPALSVAALVGPEGKVFGVDLIPEMVAAARREASRLGLENVRFDVASADQLPFAPDTFDAALNRFGVMFFPSPMDAVRDMLRVLKPGRKLALAVWHFADRNPFHCSLSRVVDRFIDPPPVAPDAPDAFRFATPGQLLEICDQAGVVAPVERVLQFKIDAPVPAEDFWALRLEMSEKLREKIARLPTDQMAEVHRLAVESLSEYSTDHGLSFPAEALIVSGTKGRSGLT